MATVASLAYQIVADTKGFVTGMRNVEDTSDDVKQSFNELAKDTGELENDTGGLRAEYQRLADQFEVGLNLLRDIGAFVWRNVTEQIGAAVERLNDLSQASRELGMEAGELEAWRRASELAFGDPTHLEKMNEEQRELLMNTEEFAKLLESERFGTEYLTEGVKAIEEMNVASSKLRLIWEDIINSLVIGFANALPTGALDEAIRKLEVIVDLMNLGIRRDLTGSAQNLAGAVFPIQSIGPSPGQAVSGAVGENIANYLLQLIGISERGNEEQRRTANNITEQTRVIQTQPRPEGL